MLFAADWKRDCLPKKLLTPKVEVSLPDCFVRARSRAKSLPAVKGEDPHPLQSDQT